MMFSGRAAAVLRDAARVICTMRAQRLLRFLCTARDIRAHLHLAVGKDERPASEP